MSIVRVVKDKNYTTVCNTHLRNKDMSLKAKGLLDVMLSLPDDWDFSIKGLTTQCCDGETSISSALKELETFNYLRRNKVRDDKGKIVDIEYIVYEIPQLDYPKLENPNMDNPNVENQAQLNTIYQLNTKKENTKTTNKEINKEIATNISLAIEYLNEKTGARYRKDTPQTVRLLKNILSVFTLDDIKNVIDKKCEEWKGTEYETYLRPMTLFGSKFENYLNSKVRRRSQVGKHIEESLEGYDHLFG